MQPFRPLPDGGLKHCLLAAGDPNISRSPIPPRPLLSQPFRPLPDWEFKDYLGWMEQGDGKLAYGIYIQVRAWASNCFCGLVGPGTAYADWLLLSRPHAPRPCTTPMHHAHAPRPASAHQLPTPASPWPSPTSQMLLAPLLLQNGRVKGEAKKALRNVIER